MRASGKKIGGNNQQWEQALALGFLAANPPLLAMALALPVAAALGGCAPHEEEDSNPEPTREALPPQSATPEASSYTVITPHPSSTPQPTPTATPEISPSPAPTRRLYCREPEANQGTDSFVSENAFEHFERVSENGQVFDFYIEEDLTTLEDHLLSSQEKERLVSYVFNQHILVRDELARVSGLPANEHSQDIFLVSQERIEELAGNISFGGSGAPVQVGGLHLKSGQLVYPLLNINHWRYLLSDHGEVVEGVITHEFGHASIPQPALHGFNVSMLLEGLQTFFGMIVTKGFLAEQLIKFPVDVEKVNSAAQEAENCRDRAIEEGRFNEEVFIACNEHLYQTPDYVDEHNGELREWYAVHEDPILPYITLHVRQGGKTLFKSYYLGELEESAINNAENGIADLPPGRWETDSTDDAIPNGARIFFFGALGSQAIPQIVISQRAVISTTSQCHEDFSMDILSVNVRGEVEQGEPEVLRHINTSASYSYETEVDAIGTPIASRTNYLNGACAWMDIYNRENGPELVQRAMALFREIEQMEPAPFVFYLNGYEIFQEAFGWSREEVEEWAIETYGMIPNKLERIRYTPYCSDEVLENKPEHVCIDLVTPLGRRRDDPQSSEREALRECSIPEPNHEQ